MALCTETIHSDNATRLCPNGSRTRLLALRWSGVYHSEHVRTVLSFLAQNGYDVHFVSVEQGPESDYIPGVKTINLPGKARRGLSKAATLPLLAWRLRSVLRAVKPEVVYVFDSWTLPLAYTALFGRLHSGGRPFVYHTFDWLEPGLHGWWHSALEHLACRSADLAINVDRSRARLQKTLYGLKKLPLDLPNYRTVTYPVPLHDPQVLKDLFPDYCEDTIVLVCPTVAMPPRLTLELIDGLALLPDRYRLVTFAVESEYTALCKRRAQELDLQDRIKFLTPRAHSQWLTIVANCDIGIIFHDVNESSGYFMANSDRLASFLACGIPVVCVNVPNFEALVYKFNLGACCDPHDPSGIADAVRHIADVRPALEARKKAIRRVFVETLNFEAVGGRLLKRLGQILPSKLI